MSDNKTTNSKLASNFKIDQLEVKKLEEDKNFIEKELSIVYDALASTINGVIITDLEGKINYVNPAFLKMFEYNNKYDVINKYADELFVAKEVKSLSDVEALIERFPGETEEFLAHGKDGTKFWVEVSSSTVTDKEDRVVGRMASFVNITNKKYIEEENKRLSSELLKSHEFERQRIAQDLHDSVAQTIHASKLNFIAYQKDPNQFVDRFKVGLEFIDKASQELREVCNDLYPSILKDCGLKSTIRWYIKNYLEINNIDCVIDINLNKTLSPDLELNLYRIIKELFSNIIKHSNADQVVIELHQKKKFILLKIMDNGIGYNSKGIQDKNKGFGLLSIQHRINDLDGTMRIDSSSMKGTTVIIEIGLN